MTREKAFEILDQFPRCVECDDLNFPFHCNECDDAFYKALQELKKHDWIPVKEQLPEEKENPVTHDFCEVICYCQFGGVPKADDVRVFKFGNGHFYHGSQIMDGIVTHWQYLPEPPEEGEQE